MKYSKIIIICAFLILGAYSLLAQNALVIFKDDTATTRNYLNLEYPGGSYPAGASTTNRWKMVIYKSTDNIVDPLVNGLPTGDDVILTNPDQDGAQVILNVNIAPGTSGKLNLSAAIVHVSMIPTYIYGRIFNSEDVSTATKYMTFHTPYFVEGPGPVNVPIIPTYGWFDNPVWQWIAPQPTTHIISGAITSQWDLTGVTISATDIDPANITYDAGAYTVTVPDGWDGVITPAKAGYIFEPASRTYTDVTADTPNQDFVMKTVVVPGVPTNLAPNDITLTYTEPTAVTLSWVAPADVNVDSYKLIWNNGEVQNIGNVLNWTTPALDAGTYTWKVCAVNNTPTKNYTPVRVQINGRSTAGTNNPKADGDWAEASFTVAIAPAEYNVNITSNPTGVAIYVDGTNSGEFTPHTFIMAAGASAVYTVVLDHYTWVPVDFAVTNIASDLSCEFLGTQVPYDIPADEPTVLPPDIPIPPEVTLQILIETVGTGGAYIDPIPLGDLPTWVNPAFTPTVYFTMDLIGLGPWTITFTTSTSCWVAYYLGGNWHTVQSVLSGTDFIVTFTIDTPPKDISDIPVVLGDSDPTLPVELSAFAATITAENYVNICWITQSETGMTGFNVYRNVNNNNLSSAHKINPNLIDATNTSSTQIYNLIDKEVENGNTYYYWLECVDRSHNSTFHETSPVYLDYITPPILPEYTTMRNAYPNPFRAGSGTTIEVDVKAGDNGTVTVYNILGQVVKTFPVAEGINNLTWNARDSKGNLCGNGIYFYKLSTKTINQTKKMVIIK